MDTILLDLQTQLVIPDIDQLILGLVAHRYRHNVQPAGYYLDLTNEWPAYLSRTSVAEPSIQPVGRQPASPTTPEITLLQ